MSAAHGTTGLMAASADEGTAPAQLVPHASAQSMVGGRIGPYLVTKRLGVGGVGEVFKAVDVMLKRDVAIKVLRDELAADAIFVERFRHEAQLHAKLNHPNVASVFAFLHEGDKQFMVMEFIAGISLDEFIRSGGPVPVERALGMFGQALDGIGHAHGCGIVHRDIKPANIMLADNGQLKVMDFGIARALDSQEHLTRHGHVAGTARSMAPEQIRGKAADERSDIYALGIVLYTLLAGRAPFDGATDFELMKAQLEQAPPPLDTLVANVPASVQAAVMKALAKNPAARFQNVGEFARALDACRTELAIEPPPDRQQMLLSSRTVINPVLAGAQRLPVSVGAQRLPGGEGAQRLPASDDALRLPSDDGKRRRASDRSSWRRLWKMRPTLPRWALRAGAASVALGAIGAIGAGIVALWPQMPLSLPEPAALAARLVSMPVASKQAPAPVEPAFVSPAAQAIHEPAPTAKLPMPDEPAAAESAAAESAAALPTIPAARADAAPSRSLTIVHLNAAGAAEDTHRFKPGERISLRVTPSHDAHVYCYLQDEARRVLRFYPNRFNPSALVRAGAPLEIPGRMGFELVANSRKVMETVACFASERDIAGELPAAIVGSDFAKLPVGSLDEVSSAFMRDTGVAQARFRVAFR